MKTIEILRQKRQSIFAIAQKHGAFNLRIFGSVARGDDQPESDIDILIDVGPKTSPWFPGGLIADLEDLLHRKVDIIPEYCLHNRLRQIVLNEALEL